jgi:hypothetical protein
MISSPGNNAPLYLGHPEQPIKKPGIGTTLNMGDIYSSSDIGQFDDVENRDSDEYEHLDDIPFNYKTNYSLNPRLSTSNQYNSPTAGGIGSYAGAIGNIGNSVSESILREYITEMFLIENSIARIPGYNYLGIGNSQVKNNLGSKNVKSINIVGGSITGADNNFQGYRKMKRRGDGKTFTGGKAIELQKNQNDSEGRNVISDQEKFKSGIGLSTYDLFNNWSEEQDDINVKDRKKEEKKIKNNSSDI